MADVRIMMASIAPLHVSMWLILHSLSCPRQLESARITIIEVAGTPCGLAGFLVELFQEIISVSIGGLI